MQRISRLYVLAVVLSGAGLAGGQVNPGAPSFVPQDCHAADCINLENLNISLNVPVMSKNGALPFRFGMSLNSYVFVASNQWYLGTSIKPLAGSMSGFLSLLYTVTAILCPDGHTRTTRFSNWGLQSSDGTPLAAT